MNIQSIKIADNGSGLKGLIITHLVQEIKDGYPFQTPTKSEPKYPIHLGLEKKFKELREHLLNVCEIGQNPRTKDEFEYDVNDTEILEVHVAADGFRLVGNKKMTDTKIIKLKTYFVEEDDGYFKFAEVKKIIGEILEEVREYVAGNRQISVEEMGQRYLENLISKGKKGAEDLVEFQSLSDDGKKEFCTKFLKDNGAIDITFVDDFEIPVETPVMNLKAG